ncbi:MAG: PAS domain S-box protein [Proteobacteria bacterium]|nr:PAS domain S-box protein [Pseudomonadota bacterium]
MKKDDSPRALKTRLLTMMVLRVVLALTFLGATTWIQVTEYSYSRLNFYPLYTIVVIISLLTILYAVFLGRVRNFIRFIYIQVTIDIALVTAIVYVTGGIASYLQILYLLVIVGATILLGRRGGLYAAAAASITYGAMLDLDFYGILPLSYKVFWGFMRPQWEDVLTTLSTNFLAFFTVAYLTGYLAEKMKAAEQKLEEKEIDFERLEELNRNIVENISSGIMTLDIDGRITSFNKAATEITGYGLRGVYYKNLEVLFPSLLEAGAESGSDSIRLEKAFKTKDGRELYLGFTVSEGGSGDAARIITFQDLTHLKGVEEELRRVEKLKALGELSIGIAHEVRNPLASISGSIQVLKSELSLDETDTRLMDIVVRETDRLNSLITDFLLFARPAKETLEVLNLEELVTEKVDIFRNSPQAIGIELQNELDSPLFVDGNVRQLGQVFWNLLLNAAQSMDGSGCITIGAICTNQPVESTIHGVASEPVQRIEVTVTDTGAGIEPDRIPLVFDPFFSTKDDGTGLGLAIVHRIIESHGGRIEVKSTLGVGTEITILLPVASVSGVH